jgi:hypothetical protein
MPPGTNRWNRGQKQRQNRILRRLFIIYQVSRHLGVEYDKASDEVFEKLKPKLEDALHNAGRLAFENAELGQPRRNPSTYAHELIKVLLRFDPSKQQ